MLCLSLAFLTFACPTTINKLMSGRAGSLCEISFELAGFADERDPSVTSLSSRCSSRSGPWDERDLHDEQIGHIRLSPGPLIIRCLAY